MTRTGEFFARNGLLFQNVDQLKSTLDGLNKAEPMIRDLATDQSLRGLTTGVDNALMAVRSKYLTLDDLAASFNMISDTLDKIIAGQPASFSWRVLAQRKPAEKNELRGFIEVRPVLDYKALEPGHAAIAAIRSAAAEVAPQYQATVRLTGPVPMADEEFATLKENAELNGIITLGIVLFILWLALRSKRLILAVFINLFVGLSLTAAWGLFMVGAFNLISVSFAVLFVGIGVDFGIQYAVRYRHERHERGDLSGSIRDAGKYVGAPLTLAAGATAAGFLSFLPTAYRGVSELGLIAGCGMLIAFATSITLLPALIRVLNPPGEPEALGYKSLAPVDSFMERNRVPIIVTTAVLVVAGLPLLYWLRFDFNPVNLRSPKVELVATYLELSREPESNTNTIGVLAPSLKEADAVGARLLKVPEVSRVMTLSSFVPEGQNEKLPLIRTVQKNLSIRARSQGGGGSADRRGQRRGVQRDGHAAQQVRRQPAGAGGRCLAPARHRALNHRKGRSGVAHARRTGVPAAAEGIARRACAGARRAAVDPAVAAGRPDARLDRAGRPRARLGGAERRPQR